RVTAEDCRAGLEGNELRLTLAVPQAPVWVHGDATRLAQVLTNLLTNAAKFTNPGGQVTVGVEADPGRGWATVTVRDTGVGIEPAMLPHVFETSAQDENCLDRNQEGMGLGLALVKGLVGLHGGEVRAASAGPGQGAEFTFWLPLAATPAPAGAGAERPAPVGEALRILVVEDHRDAAETLRMLLELLGHEVAVAHNGPAGVEAARRFRPDVVLSDLGLPGLDGFAVARALRDDPDTAALRLIALSGYGTEEDRRRCLEAGFDLHLTKPIDLEQLQ